MSNFVQSVGVSLNRALVEMGARPGKVSKAEAPSQKGQGRPDTEGLSEASRAHVEEMLKAGMSAVANVMEQRISTVEATATEIAGKNAELEDMVRKCQEALGRQNADINALRVSLDKHVASCKDRF